MNCAGEILTRNEEGFNVEPEEYAASYETPFGRYAHGLDCHGMVHRLLSSFEKNCDRKALIYWFRFECVDSFHISRSLLLLTSRYVFLSLDRISRAIVLS